MKRQHPYKKRPTRINVTHGHRVVAGDTPRGAIKVPISLLLAQQFEEASDPISRVLAYFMFQRLELNSDGVMEPIRFTWEDLEKVIPFGRTDLQEAISKGYAQRQEFKWVEKGRGVSSISVVAFTKWSWDELGNIEVTPNADLQPYLMSNKLRFEKVSMDVLVRLCTPAQRNLFWLIKQNEVPGALSGACDVQHLDEDRLFNVHGISLSTTLVASEVNKFNLAKCGYHIEYDAFTFGIHWTVV